MEQAAKYTRQKRNDIQLQLLFSYEKQTSVRKLNGFVSHITPQGIGVNIKRNRDQVKETVSIKAIELTKMEGLIFPLNVWLFSKLKNVLYFSVLA